MLCVLTNHCAWRSCSHESEGANWRRDALGNGRKLRPPAEPIDDGRRAGCSLVHCHQFPLESYDCQVQWPCHAVEWLGDVQAEAVG